jgi:hypothetical protein
MLSLGLSKKQIAEMVLTGEEVSALQNSRSKIAELAKLRDLPGADIAALNQEIGALSSARRTSMDKIKELGLRESEIAALTPQSGLSRLEAVTQLSKNHAEQLKLQADKANAAYSVASGIETSTKTGNDGLLGMVKGLNPFAPAYNGLKNGGKSVDAATNLTELENIVAGRRFRTDAKALGTASLIWHAPQEYGQWALGNINPDTQKPYTFWDATKSTGGYALLEGVGGATTVAGLRMLGSKAKAFGQRLSAPVPEVPMPAGMELGPVSPTWMQRTMPTFSSGAQKISDAGRSLQQSVSSNLLDPAKVRLSGGYNWMMGDHSVAQATRNYAYLFGPSERTGTMAISGLAARSTNFAVADMQRPLANGPMPEQPAVAVEAPTAQPQPAIAAQRGPKPASRAVAPVESADVPDPML